MAKAIFLDACYRAEAIFFDVCRTVEAIFLDARRSGSGILGAGHGNECMSEPETIHCDPARCPLCGEPNACARAADPAATECWCAEQTFPRNLLERVPERAVRRACICLSCVENHPETATE